MLQKRGQIVYFLLIGIILAVGASVIFYIKESGVQKQSAFEPKVAFTTDVKEIQLYAKSCTEDVGDAAKDFVAKRGGYFDLPQAYVPGQENIAYFYYNGRDVTPTLDGIVSEIAEFLERQLKPCMDRNELPEYKLEIVKKDIEVAENDSFVTLKIPFKITLRGKEILADFPLTFDKQDKVVRSFQAAKNITNETSQHPGFICFTCVYKTANNTNMDFVIDYHNSSTYVFSLGDRNETDYHFNFAMDLHGP